MKQGNFKRVLVKEEMMLLTKERVEAVVLSQLLYWSRRVKDYQALLREEDERERHGVESAAIPCHGWIFKSAEELSEETILGFSASTVRRALIRLVEKGYLYERSNPLRAWDRTKQYRVNLLAIVQGLAELELTVSRNSLLSDDASRPEPRPADKHPAKRIRHVARSIRQAVQPIRHGEAAIPETTPEITDQDKSHPQTPSSHRVEYQSTAPDRGGQTVADPGLVAHPAPRRGHTLAEPDFQAFWAAYPKQVGQWSAYRAWQAALSRRTLRPVTAADLISAAQNYAQSVVGRDPRYILQPATFLGPDSRYLEFLDVPRLTRAGGKEQRNNGSTQVCWEQDYRPYSQRSEVELVRMLNELSPHFLSQVEPHVRHELNSRGFDACLLPGSLTYTLSDLTS